MAPTASWESAADTDLARSAASAATAVARATAEGTQLTAADLDAMLARASEIPWDHAAAIRARVDFGQAGTLAAADLVAVLEDMASNVDEHGESCGGIVSVGNTIGHSATTTSDELNPWRRTISQLSVALADESRQSARMPRVDVRTDGVVRGAFYDRHAVFAIDVNGRPAASRRFSEFVWLRGELLRRHALRTIPALPARRMHAVPLALRPSSVLDASHGSALDERRRGLHAFLMLVAGHPVLGKDAAFAAFLDGESNADVRSLRFDSGDGLSGPDSTHSEAPATESLPSSPGHGQTTHSAADYALDWTPYRDAVRWAGVVGNAADSLRGAAQRIAAAHALLGTDLAAADAAASKLLANTAESTASHTFLADIARATGDGAAPYNALADAAKVLGLLATATRAMAGAVRSAKFTAFPALLASLVEAQGAAERLRLQGPAAYASCAPSSSSIASLLFVRGDASATGTAAWEEALRRENARVSSIQNELRRRRARNAAADGVLRDELVWVVSVLRALVPAMLEDVRSSLHAHHSIIGNLL